jgi:hypothetical protein
MIRGACVATLALLAGCMPLTKERVTGVDPGRCAREDVRRALGEPTLSSPDRAVYLGSDGRQAVVYYDSRGVVTQRFWWPPAEEAPAAPGKAVAK